MKHFLLFSLFLTLSLCSFGQSMGTHVAFFTNVGNSYHDSINLPDKKHYPIYSSNCDSFYLEIQVLSAQNSRLRSTNIILNEKLHEYFEHILRLAKDSANKQEVITSLLEYSKLNSKLYSDSILTKNN